MGFPRLIVWLLAAIWVASFVCFMVVSQIAFVSGTTFEYRLYGVQFPYLAFALPAFMAASSGLLWANYRAWTLAVPKKPSMVPCSACRCSA
jgi:hypothetical protein